MRTLPRKPKAVHFDEGVEAVTVREGWIGIQNGELLCCSEEVAVFVTTDGWAFLLNRILSLFLPI